MYQHFIIFHVKCFLKDHLWICISFLRLAATEWICYLHSHGTLGHCYGPFKNLLYTEAFISVGSRKKANKLLYHSSWVTFVLGRILQNIIGKKNAICDASGSPGRRMDVWRAMTEWIALLSLCGALLFSAGGKGQGWVELLLSSRWQEGWHHRHNCPTPLFFLTGSCPPFWFPADRIWS